MGSTNKTTNYELSQFLGSDKPAWLLDYNGDMQKIDTQMKANADAASAAQSKADTADGKADDLRTDLTTLNNQVNDPTGLAADVATLSGTMNTVTSLIGNGEPTTTDKTLIGAINEIAAGLGYMIKNAAASVSVTADGVKDNKTLLGELYAAMENAVNNLAADELYEYTSIAIPNWSAVSPYRTLRTKTDPIDDNFTISGNNAAFAHISQIELRTGTGSVMRRYIFKSTPEISIVNDSDSVPNNGTTFTIYYRVWTKNVQ